MELFILWVTCSVFIAIFASSINRSGLGWFLLSLFISPLVALLFLAILPKRGSSALTLEFAQSLENKLKEVERLKMSGLIAEEEYLTVRKLIIESN